MDWTPEIIDVVKPLYEGGMSAARIAAELDAKGICVVTRNAVIGIAHRKGWTTSAPKQRMASDRVRSRKERRAAPSRVSFYPQRRVFEAPHDIEPAPLPISNFNDSTISPEQRKTVLTVGLHECRYVVADDRPGKFFCGRAQTNDSSYCLEHHLRCHWRPGAP